MGWDYWGNLTSYYAHTCEWDDSDRLTKFDRDGSSTYDADYYYLPGSWKRYKRTLGGTTEYYVYDGDNVVASYDSGGNLNASYLTPGLDANLSMTNSTDTYYYFADGLGSIRNVVESDEDKGRRGSRQRSSDMHTWTNRGQAVHRVARLNLGTFQPPAGHQKFSDYPPLML